MKNPLLFLLFGIGITGCAGTSENSTIPLDPAKAKAELFDKIYSDDNLKSQLFEIDCTRDTSIVSKNGIIYRIYANSFTSNASGSLKTVSIEVKEALSPVDFVLANLTTTSNGKILESDGMIYINATSNGDQLRLAKGKEIGVMLPDKSLKEDMSIYVGEKVDEKINWVEPEPIMNSELKSLERTYSVVTYYHHGDSTASADEHEKVDDWLWKAGRKAGDKVTIGQSRIEVLSFSKSTVSIRESVNGVFKQDVLIKKGQNGFVEDFNTNYIFSVKKLGWANIDRLFSNPKSKEVDFIVSVPNNKEFGYVFISLILPDNNMYIPGYQKKDDRFGFSHDDSERMILPIGAEAIVLATAYKDDTPYFCMKKITINEKTDVSLLLKETDIETLKKELENKI